MPIFHVVEFQFKQDNPEQVRKICQAFLALKNNCRHASTKKPYIRSVTGGANNSTEGFSYGMTHIFVMEFASIADRQHYLKQDPAFPAFKAFAKPMLIKFQVVDFEKDIF